MSKTNAPMPGYRHPSLPDIDPDQVDLSHVTYMVPGAMTARYTAQPLEPTTSTMQTGTLTMRKCFGPAPYVGRPFVYMWRALVADDGTNRALAGCARIAYKPMDYRDPATFLKGEPADDAL